jgi:hypothetical protein
MGSQSFCDLTREWLSNEACPLSEEDRKTYARSERFRVWPEAVTAFTAQRSVHL